MNRTVERVITIEFAPLDDIRGRVRDRFDGTYLAGYKPAAVMQGPFTGWVAAVSDWDSVKVPVDADGRYALPKLPPAKHTLRAFLTNGRDSSFIATYTVSSGDQTFDIGVETNAGTGMPLRRLLSMYQTVNFRSESWGSGLVGSDLKGAASNYAYYLVGKDMATPWLNAKRLTAEQQNWLAHEIQTRCLAHLPSANRPRIVNGGPNDTLPVGEKNSPYADRTSVLYNGSMIIYANSAPWRNDLTIWEVVYDPIYDYARIALDGGDDPAPPYGFSMSAIVSLIGKTISGNASLLDQYYCNKTVRAENTVLDIPSIADMKLDWQVVFETPGRFTYVEAKYFGMIE
jgi:hypothetical protein